MNAPRLRKTEPCILPILVLVVWGRDGVPGQAAKEIIQRLFRDTTVAVRRSCSYILFWAYYFPLLGLLLYGEISKKITLRVSCATTKRSTQPVALYHMIDVPNVGFFERREVFLRITCAVWAVRRHVKMFGALKTGGRIQDDARRGVLTICVAKKLASWCQLQQSKTGSLFIQHIPFFFSCEYFACSLQDSLQKTSPDN